MVPKRREKATQRTMVAEKKRAGGFWTPARRSLWGTVGDSDASCAVTLPSEQM